MALKTSRTVILQTSDGDIKVTPLGGRLVSIAAPKHVQIRDRKGRVLKSLAKRSGKA
jgi:hypothetical protein